MKIWNIFALYGLFQMTTTTEEDVAEALYPSLKQEIIIQLDLAAPEKLQGESAEMHKEPVDKDAMRKLLVSLSEDVACERVVYGEEVRGICP